MKIIHCMRENCVTFSILYPFSKSSRSLLVSFSRNLHCFLTVDTNVSWSCHEHTVQLSEMWHVTSQAPVCPTQDPGSISEWMTASRDLELIQKVKWKLYCCFHYIHLLFAEFVIPVTTEFAFYRDVRPLQAHIRTCTYFTLYNCLMSWDPSPGSG